MNLKSKQKLTKLESQLNIGRFQGIKNELQGVMDPKKFNIVFEKLNSVEFDLQEVWCKKL